MRDCASNGSPQRLAHAASVPAALMLARPAVTCRAEDAHTAVMLAKELCIWLACRLEE